MRFFLPFLIVLIFSGCASGPTTKQIVGPDGTPHVLVTCGAIEKCFEDARIACNGNYQLVNVTPDVVGISNAAGYGWGNFGASTGSVYTRQKMLVKCDPAAPAPDLQITKPSPTPAPAPPGP